MPPTATALSAELGLFLRPARRRLLRETFVLFLRLLSPHDPLALGSCGDLVGAHIARPPSSASVGADALIGPYDCTAEPAPWDHASPVRHAVRRDLLRGLLLGPAPLRCSPSAQALLPLLTTAQRFCLSRFAPSATRSLLTAPRKMPLRLRRRLFFRLRGSLCRCSRALRASSYFTVHAMGMNALE